MKVAVRNKHFTLASRFANIVCRACTHWEPRERISNPESRVSPSLPKTSKASIQIEDEDHPSDEDELDPATEIIETQPDPESQRMAEPPTEDLSGRDTELNREVTDSGEAPTIEVKPKPAGWIQLEDPESRASKDSTESVS